MQGAKPDFVIDNKDRPKDCAAIAHQVVSEMAAAQAVPIIRVPGRALVNTIFIDHFQDMAAGHFVVRRLKRIYGKEVVKRAYEGAV